MKAYYKEVGLEYLCELFGFTRQAYYKAKNKSERQRFEEAIIIDLVKKERKIARRVGVRKLYQILSPLFGQYGIKIGRDGLFELLNRHDLLVKKRKRYKQTTNSKHHLRKYPNLTTDLKIDHAEQLWVSDITYIEVKDSKGYLILITDSYSKKVVGYHVATKMDTAFCLVALRTALGGRMYDHDLVHHSDRGLQYCSFDYTDELKSGNIGISMTQNGDPYENALAERMNRTFKSEFGIDRIFENINEAKRAIDQAVEYYNTRLPHDSCDKMTPEQAHLCTGELKKHWKAPQKAVAL